MEQQLQQLTIGKVVVGAFVVALLYYLLLYNDGTAIQASIGTTNAEIQTKEQELEKIKVAIADAERYQRTKNALGEELGTVLKAIPEKLSTTEIMRFLSNEAKNLGVNISSVNASSSSMNFQASPGEEKPFYEPIAVAIALEGTYTNLMLFLSAITKSDKIITAPSLTLESKAAAGVAPDDNGPTILRLVGEFRAYRYLPQNASGATQ